MLNALNVSIFSVVLDEMILLHVVVKIMLFLLGGMQSVCTLVSEQLHQSVELVATTFSLILTDALAIFNIPFCHVIWKICTRYFGQSQFCITIAWKSPNQTSNSIPV